MNDRIDKNFRQWLNDLADDWKLPLEQVVGTIGADEINNRLEYYPLAQPILTDIKESDLGKFYRLSEKFWALGSQSNRIQVNYFCRRGQPAREAIIELIRGFPDDDEEAARRTGVLYRRKQLRAEQDSLLRCEVCGFSFVESYGERGRGFIEAHHKKPLASLKLGDETTVNDLALLCANCHRIIHRGDKTLSVDALRSLWKKYNSEQG